MAGPVGPIRTSIWKVANKKQGIVIIILAIVGLISPEPYGIIILIAMFAYIAYLGFKKKKAIDPNKSS